MRKYLIDNEPSFFELVEDFESKSNPSLRLKIAISFEAGGGEVRISEVGFFDLSGAEVGFNELSYLDQQIALQDFARMADRHITFYSQEMLDWEDSPHVG
jgi:hypothetical protein